MGVGECIRFDAAGFNVEFDTLAARSGWVAENLLLSYEYCWFLECFSWTT